MRREALLELLRRLEAGKIAPEEAADRLASLPFEDLGFAKVDHHRSLRSGMPEVILAAGKTPSQVATIFAQLAASGVNVLATRASQEHFNAVHETVPAAEFHQLARCITLSQNTPEKIAGHVAVVCAGTSDLPVAEEAAITAELFGACVTRITDVGVADVGEVRHLGSGADLGVLDLDERSHLRALTQHRPRAQVRERPHARPFPNVGTGQVGVNDSRLVADPAVDHSR